MEPLASRLGICVGGLSRHGAGAEAGRPSQVVGPLLQN